MILGDIRLLFALGLVRLRLGALLGERGGYIERLALDDDALDARAAAAAARIGASAASPASAGRDALGLAVGAARPRPAARPAVIANELR